MAEKKINPVLKQVLELGPTLAFFLLYLRIRDETYTWGGTEYSGFIVAALVFVPILLVAMAMLFVVGMAIYLLWKLFEPKRDGESRSLIDMVVKPAAVMAVGVAFLGICM